MFGELGMLGGKTRSRHVPHHMGASWVLSMASNHMTWALGKRRAKRVQKYFSGVVLLGLMNMMAWPTHITIWDQ